METYEEAKKFYEETFNEKSAAIRLARWAEANGMTPKKEKAAKKEEPVEKKADEE